MSDITKLKSTADIIGGSVFFADANGVDPEYPNNGDLLPDGMYIRIEGSDGSLAYISAYELDKSMDIINQASANKANISDIEYLKEIINEKVSNNKFDILSDELSTKADKSSIDEIKSDISTKADISTVNEVSNELSTKADKSSIDEIKSDINILQELIGSASDSSTINTIQKQIDYLNSELKKRLTKDDLSSINSNIDKLKTSNADLKERLELAELNINKKASTVYVQKQISEVNTTITDLSNKVDNKPNRSEINSKADKSDVDAILKKVTTINSNVGALSSDLSDMYVDVNKSLNTKADKVVLDNISGEIDDINANLSKKADKSVLSDFIDDANNRFSEIEETEQLHYSELKEDINEIDCEVNNKLTEFKATVANQSKQLSNQANQISDLQKTDAEYREQIKNEWVRVMTPEEYNRLPPVGSMYSNGMPNPFAKKPNVLYMLVRFNKPIAVYIGEVLIAQAEQKGDTGFVYSFPIIF